VGTYPCSNCGARADTASGCPNCGRSVEREIAELSQVITKMQFRNVAMVDERSLLMKRLQGAITTRSLLQKAVAERSGVTGAVRRAATRTAPKPSKQRRPEVRATRRLPDGTVEVTAPPARPGKAVPLVTTEPDQQPVVHQPEASTGSMQNALLGLGALLFAATAVALSGYLRATLGAGGREALFILLTVALLALPRSLARRSLTATAETVAVVGLMFVLLDGWTAWSARWLSGSGIPSVTYAGVITLIAAGVAAGYRWFSHLIAPRFAAIVLLQPVLPLLLGFTAMQTLAGWATVLSAVAAMDVGLALLLRRAPDSQTRAAGTGPLRRWSRPRQPDAAGAARSVPPRWEGTPYLLEAVWALHALGVLAAAGCATAGLARAHTVTEALAGAAALLLAGTAGLYGALVLGRPPLPDLGSGLATLAVIGALGRLAAVALPGRGLVLTAGAVLATSAGVRFVTPVARRGAQRAGALAAGALGVIILARGFDTITAPLRAAGPAWRADLDRYPSALASAAGPDGWQLAVAAALLTIAAVGMLPPGTRTDGAIAGTTLTLLLLPAGFGVAWALTPVLLLVGAVVAGALGLLAGGARSAWVRVGAALVLGCYATEVALARAGAAALVLTVIVIAGTAIGAPPRLSLSPGYGRYGPYAGDAALAGAAFALPGAIAFGTVALAPPAAGPLPVLAASYLAVAGTLAGAALAQVAQQAPNPILVTGATLGAATVAAATFVARITSLVDVGVAILLLAAGLALLLAPAMDTGQVRAGRGRARGAGRGRARGAGRAGGAGRSRLSGADLAAVLVTTAALAAVARVCTLISPRYALVSVAVLVLMLAVGIRSMPPAWRRGPIVGGSLVASAAALAATVGAAAGAIEVLRALPPIWHTDLAGWHVSPDASFGAQTPVALALLAIAAWVALPAPWAQITSVIGIGLSALAIPAGFDLGWWSPILFSGAVAAGAGLAAGASLDPRVAWARGTVGTLLFADTVAASLVAPDTTGSTLIGSAAILAGVAVTASASRRRFQRAGAPPVSTDHLVKIGGSALAAAVVAVSAAAACLAYARSAPDAVLFTSAFAALCACLGVVGLACYNDETYLPHLTAGLAVGGTAIAVATVRTADPTEVYAAATALLVVLAELLHVSIVARRASLSGAGLRANDPALQPRRSGLRPGYTMLLAAGPATAIALLQLGPSVLAALVGPYQWLGRVWEGPPARADQALDGLSHWLGSGTVVVAALVLTIAAALAAVGLGGSQTTVAARAVAVVIPGAAMTLLVMPAVLRMPWAYGPASALAVSALAGLGVALTSQPPDSTAARPLRRARRLVMGICVLAGGAGLTGSLAAPAATLIALGAAVTCGLIAALYGRSRVGRLVGWLVTASAGHLLALVAGLVAGLPVYESAFLVTGVAGGLLVLAALLPGLRRPDAARESTAVEASSYAGAVLALLLASRSLQHLAIFCTVWGAVLGVAAARPGRTRVYRSVLIWFAAAHEVVAWWLLMRISHVVLTEAYTLAVALVALFTGYLEYRRNPEISSWYAYGVALLSAFVPSLAIVLSSGQTPLRRALLIVGAAATVAYGSMRRQQAPVVVGGVVLAIAALYEVAVLSAVALLLVVMGLVGVALVGLGANYEKRRRNIQRLRGAIGRLR
jgi:hypothetical protein